MVQLSRNPHVVALIDLVGNAGGAESVASELLQRLDAARYDRTLVVYQRLPAGSGEARGQLEVADRLRRSGVRVLELGRRDRWDLRAWRPFLELLRSGGVDILHSHKFGPNVWAAVFSRLHRAPVVIAHEHTWSFEGQPLRKLADRFVVASECDAFLAVSDEDRRRMIAIERVPEERVRLLPNGIPVPEVHSGSDVRGELGLPLDARLVVAVGVFREQKGFTSLVEAFARVRGRLEDAHLAIVGDGPTRPEVESAVHRMRLGDRVHLVGMRSDALRFVAAADVAVNSSIFEGASLALLEYMALGRPIVATSVGGTPELLDGGQAGVLVGPADPPALGDAIIRLLLDDEAATALGRRARARQRSEYDIDVQLERLEGLYAELLDGARQRGRAVAGVA